MFVAPNRVEDSIVSLQLMGNMWHPRVRVHGDAVVSSLVLFLGDYQSFSERSCSTDIEDGKKSE
jgi:hypothetical protein